MFKKTLLAASISLLAAGSNASTLSVDYVMPLSTDAQPAVVTNQAQSIAIAIDPVPFSGRTNTAVVKYSLTNGFFNESLTFTSFTVPQGMAAVVTDQADDGSYVTVQFTATEAVATKGSVVLDINKLKVQAPATLGVAINAVVEIDSTRAEDLTELEKAFGATSKTNYNIPLATNSSSSALSLTVPTTPFLVTTNSNVDAMINADDQDFTTGENAVLGTITIKAGTAVDSDGEPRALSDGDVVTVKPMINDTTGLASVTVDGKEIAVDSTDYNDGFVFTKLEGDTTLEISVTADDDSDTDLSVSTNTVTTEIENDEDVIAYTQANPADLADFVSYSLGQSYDINIITPPSFSESTWVRFTNRSKSPATVRATLTDQNTGDELGEGVLTTDLVAPGATVVFSSDTFATLTDGVAWTGRANAVLTTNVDADVTALLRSSNGVLTNMSSTVVNEASSLGSIQATVNGVQATVNGVQATVNGVQSSVNNVNINVGGVQSSVDNVQDVLGDLAGTLVAIEVINAGVVGDDMTDVTLDVYDAAGITGVDTDNLAAVNVYVLANGSSFNTESEIQALVNQQAAGLKVINDAILAGDLTGIEVEEFAAAGITDVIAATADGAGGNITGVKVLLLEGSTALTSLAMQGLVDAQVIALGVINAAIDSADQTGVNNLTLTKYNAAGITIPNDTITDPMKTNVYALKGASPSTVAQIQSVIDSTQ